ncbi:hypothetical protein QSJ19_03210 [Gordonia sp. ABSL11-1]|uniref:hypothetical protein n=1 Tax=Gordonia sp. ABSL11-1 TaxID=3053924 RepID=UPI00257379CF|nr:hypothetical protein [Gordonia sp. ABSL11-1]MDL9944608.1 hypothetical protein [Gordonia sp. ABSL11-1]
MPRLTHTAYLAIHEHLRRLWLHDGSRLSVLNASEQWDLHAFFVLDAAMSDADLIEFRRFVTKRDPSLPQRAGKAFNKLLRELDALDDRRAAEAARRAALPVGAKRKKRRNADRVIRTSGLVHPEPDAKKLVRALFAHVDELQRRERADELLAGPVTDEPPSRAA